MVADAAHNVANYNFLAFRFRFQLRGERAMNKWGNVEMIEKPESRRVLTQSKRRKRLIINSERRYATAYGLDSLDWRKNMLRVTETGLQQDSAINV